MSAPDAFTLALRLLRDIGVVSIDPDVPANQVTPIEATDLDDVGLVISQGLQELFRRYPAEAKMQPGSGYLHAPTPVTLTCAIGSATVSAVTTYASWMEGCTIRIDGDAADNELISSTLLARPYTGGSGSHTATVYADAITLDETVEKVMAPVFTAGRPPIPMANSPFEFMRIGQWSGVTDIQGFTMSYISLWGTQTQKSTGAYPWAWIQDAYYDPTLSYLKRRIRFTPMPTGALAIGFTQLRNPPRITGDDLSGGYAATWNGTGGALSPDSSGAYTRIGTVHGFPLFGHDGDFYLYYQSGSGYLISDQVSATAGTLGWVPGDILTTPPGTYEAYGTAAGNLTVERAGGDTTIVLPITNEAVESLLLPICRQLMTGLPQFKNAAAIGEIARAYKKANEMLDNSMGDEASITAYYPAMIRNW